MFIESQSWRTIESQIRAPFRLYWTLAKQAQRKKYELCVYTTAPNVGLLLILSTLTAREVEKPNSSFKCFSTRKLGARVSKPWNDAVAVWPSLCFTKSLGEGTAGSESCNQDKRCCSPSRRRGGPWIHQDSVTKEDSCQMATVGRSVDPLSRLKLATSLSHDMCWSARQRRQSPILLMRLVSTRIEDHRSVAAGSFK